MPTFQRITHVRCFHSFGELKFFKGGEETFPGIIIQELVTRLAPKFSFWLFPGPPIFFPQFFILAQNNPTQGKGFPNQV